MAVRRIVVADIGGTHARFALATIGSDAAISLDTPVRLQTADHASFETAWDEFRRRQGGSLPAELAIAFAGSVDSDVIKLTNNPWAVRRSLIAGSLALERLTVVNDFGAVAHAVASLPDDYLRMICGRRGAIPEQGVISVVGPGTGLGVAILVRESGRYRVIETEGGHIDFAPLDDLEDRSLAHLRANFRRVSVERIASGRGLWNIYEALGSIEKRPLTLHDEKAVWAAALGGGDILARSALDRLCMTLGSVAADMALAHGAAAVVIGGGVGLRLADYLPTSGFRERFIAKGRFERRMDNTPVALITHPEPGLHGAAAAFAQEHG